MSTRQPRLFYSSLDFLQPIDDYILTVLYTCKPVNYYALSEYCVQNDTTLYQNNACILTTTHRLSNKESKSNRTLCLKHLFEYRLFGQ